MTRLSIGLTSALRIVPVAPVNSQHSPLGLTPSSPPGNSTATCEKLRMAQLDTQSARAASLRSNGRDVDELAESSAPPPRRSARQRSQPVEQDSSAVIRKRGRPKKVLPSPKREGPVQRGRSEESAESSHNTARNNPRPVRKQRKYINASNMRQYSQL